jgi:hypothetical protein
VEYDTSYAKHCREPTAEEVRKKDEANFCDHFKPKAGAYVAKTEGAALPEQNPVTYGVAKPRVTAEIVSFFRSGGMVLRGIPHKAIAGILLMFC